MFLVNIDISLTGRGCVRAPVRGRGRSCRPALLTPVHQRLLLLLLLLLLHPKVEIPTSCGQAGVGSIRIVNGQSVELAGVKAAFVIK